MSLRIVGQIAGRSSTSIVFILTAPAFRITVATVPVALQNSQPAGLPRRVPAAPQPLAGGFHFFFSLTIFRQIFLASSQFMTTGADR